MHQTQAVKLKQAELQLREQRQLNQECIAALEDTERTAMTETARRMALELRHEPTNQHDPYAVGVFSDGIRVGYMQKEVSAAVAWLLAIKMPMKTTLLEVGKSNNLVLNIVEDKA